MMKKKKTISRRKFITTSALTASALAASGAMIAPRHVLGGKTYTSPSEKLNIAGIGVGGQGRGDINKFSLENIVALCDVDWKRAARTFRAYPEARKYKDFREMLAAEEDLDAVVIATPDHTHAVAAMAAMKRGLHVFVEKPMAKTIKEVQMLTQEARKRGLTTQMGSQGHADDAMRKLREYLEDGAIGEVRQVDAWTPHAVWPQGIDRPTGWSSIPSTLDWDSWLGPAPDRQYHSDYLPTAWRGRWDFGTGALGDMGCHIFDPICYALKLNAPISVEACFSMFVPEKMNWDKKFNEESYPRASIVRYQYGARGDLPPLKLTWYDGGLMPERPAELDDDARMGSPYGGALFIGDEGKIICKSHGAQGMRIIPREKMEAYQPPAEKYPRVKNHYDEWVEACKAGKQSGCNFAYAGPLSEMVLLGNIAIRTGKKIYWDAEKREITNVPEANDYLHYEYREGWSL